MLKKYLLFIIILCSNGLVLAAELISIEAKEYTNNDAIIFYHHKNLNLNVQYYNKKITVTSTKSIDHNVITPALVRRFITNISAKRNSITLSTFDNYTNYDVVKGEKFTAIKFKTNKAFAQSAKNPDKELKQVTPEASVLINPLLKDDILPDVVFNFSRSNVGAAAFTRGNKLWLIFDQPSNNLYKLPNYLKKTKNLKTKASVLKMELPNGTMPYLHKVNNNWVLSSKAKLGSEKPTPIVVEQQKGGLYNLKSNNLSSIVEFTDPEIGDNVTVITSNKATVANNVGRFHFGFNMPESIQGIVINWSTDNKEVKLVEGGATIQMPFELKLYNTASVEPKALNAPELPKVEAVAKKAEVSKEVAPVSFFEKYFKAFTSSGEKQANLEKEKSIVSDVPEPKDEVAKLAKTTSEPLEESVKNTKEEPSNDVPTEKKVEAVEQDLKTDVAKASIKPLEENIKNTKEEISVASQPEKKVEAVEQKLTTDNVKLAESSDVNKQVKVADVNTSIPIISPKSIPNESKVLVPSEEDKLAINAPLTLPVALTAAKPQAENAMPQKNISYLYKDPVKTNNKGFYADRAELTLNLSKASDDDLLSAAFNLAKFYFSHQLYNESLGVLNLVNDKIENFIQTKPEYLLFKGVNLAILKRWSDSIACLNKLISMQAPENLKAEAKIWKHYANYISGQNIEDIGVDNYLDNIMENYHNDLYWPLVLAELNISLKANQVNNAYPILQKIRKAPTISVQNNLDLFEAHYLKQNKKLSLAINKIEKVQKNKDEDIEGYVKAEYDYVDLLLDNEQIKPKDAIVRLEKLKYLWRGDDLEFKILLKNAELLLANKDYIKSLRAYKYILGSFPNNSNSFFITHEMVNIYNNFIFASDGLAVNISDFDLVALFYEFKELTPIGSGGDRVVLIVSKSLINLDLLEEAEDILTHQVQYRLKGVERIVTADHLALVYIMNNKAKEAIKILNDTDLVNYGFLEHLSRQRLKSKAYLDLGDYNNAYNVIANDEDPNSTDIKREIYFKTAKWQDYISLTESEILPIISERKKIPEELNKETLRLAVSYAMLGKSEDLKTLENNLFTDNETLKNSISLIISSNETIDIEKLDRIFNIDKIDNYFKSLKNKLFNI